MPSALEAVADGVATLTAVVVLVWAVCRRWVSWDLPVCADEAQCHGTEAA